MRHKLVLGGVHDERAVPDVLADAQKAKVAYPALAEEARIGVLKIGKSKLATFRKQQIRQPKTHRTVDADHAGRHRHVHVVPVFDRVGRHDLVDGLVQHLHPRRLVHLDCAHVHGFEHLFRLLHGRREGCCAGWLD